MKITFLGQNGLLIESKNSTIIIDPYLSDSVEKIEPLNKRKQPIDERFLKVKPNVVVITHTHADHYDEETLDKILGANGNDEIGIVKENGGSDGAEENGEIDVVKEKDEILGTENDCVFFSPPSVFFKAKARYPKCNHIVFRSGTSVTIGGLTFRAVKAEHSDAEAIGVIISAEDKTLYITGDTLYSENVFESVFKAFENLPEAKINALFLPVNGRGNNMNARDAGRFAARINPDFVVPVHYGMFDELNGLKIANEIKTEFKNGDIIISEIYKEIKIG